MAMKGGEGGWVDRGVSGAAKGTKRKDGMGVRGGGRDCGGRWGGEGWEEFGEGGKGWG